MPVILPLSTFRETRFIVLSVDVIMLVSGIRSFTVATSMVMLPNAAVFFTRFFRFQLGRIREFSILELFVTVLFVRKGGRRKPQRDSENRPLHKDPFQTLSPISRGLLPEKQAC